MRHPAEDVRRQNRAAVLANRVQVADRWGRQCRAYNVCMRPDAAAAAELSGLQARALQQEPSLLRVPERALHANLVWLLPVNQEFDLAKDELWQRRGPQWHTTLADAATKTRSFRLTFRHLVATSSAVIIVADEPNPFSGLRQELMPALDLPGRASAGDLAHVTLFRYAGPLRDPAALLEWAAATTFRLDIDVSELLVIKERVYPCLDYEILHRLPLGRPH
jgi:hypothetical protein